MNKRKQKVAILSLMILILIVGISYAFFSTTLAGNKENVIKVGKLDLVLDESMSNGITISKGVAVTDAVGLASTPSSFSLVNNSSVKIAYSIYLTDLPLTSGTRIADKYIKYSLDKGTTVGSAKVLMKVSNDNSDRLLDSGVINGKETINFKLRLWLNSAENANYSNQIFSAELRVDATQSS